MVQQKGSDSNRIVYKKVKRSIYFVSEISNLCGYSGCKERCYELSVKASGGNYSLYALGYRYCGCCQYYFDTRQVFCPCCGRKLRSKPTAQARYYKYKDGRTIWAKQREKSRIE